MALVLKDRVKETTVSTGTGPVVLGGASTGYQSFSVIGDGNTTYYTITDGTSWEVGIGTYTAATLSLSRDTILESSNNGNAVNWGAGVKDVFCTMPAEKAMSVDGGNGPAVISANSGSGTAALQITQTGSGNVLLVEDSTSPDATPTVIDAFGNLILGYTSRTRAISNKVEINSISSETGISPSLGLTNWSTALTRAGNISFSHSPSGVIGTNADNRSGELLGSINFYTRVGSTLYVGNISANTDSSLVGVNLTYYGNQHKFLGKIIKGSQTYSFGGEYLLWDFTTSATPVFLTLDALDPTDQNQIVLVNDSSLAFKGIVTARQKASDGTASAAWSIEGLIRRDANAASTTVITSSVTVIDNTPGWSLAISADTTNGALAIAATGASATNIVWSASVSTVQASWA